MKENEMDRTCSTYWGDKKWIGFHKWGKFIGQLNKLQIFKEKGQATRIFMFKLSQKKIATERKTKEIY
jgi:hypothetical protein